MKGKHALEKEKGRMARGLVYYCVGILTASTVWAAVITTVAAVRGWTVDLSAVLTFIGAAFGGELLALLAKRLFARPGETLEETTETNENTEEGNG